MAWWVAVVSVVAGLCGLPVAAENINDTINDLFWPLTDVQEGRFFSYDKVTPFNASLSFTIPLFSFTLPGANDFTASGLSTQSFAYLTFISLFLLGAFGVAVYTATHKAWLPGGREDSEAKYLQDSFLTNRVVESVLELPKVVDTRSCASLAICGAYADRHTYGYLAWPIRFLSQFTSGTAEETETEFQKAAKYGEEDGQDCLYEFPCLVQPLDLLLFMHDYWLGSE
ncbi:uncharacterized protein [Procambarus clarkii]|uniref:uncharacterized protein n=1 Tax=Procambarus clarkii TaxID=6728 RepID=UPI003743B775